MTDSQTKLKLLLRELFQLDNADLDFGIYRIMNAKRVEIERFLDDDLLPQVKTAFEQYQSSDSVGIKTELDKTIQQAKEMGVADAELLPKVKELRGKLAAAVDVSALESQVFSDLYNFFRRYYSEGDFLSLRRYKEGVYAIPYEGEEVKLHWANHDQYYVKSSEFLRDYTFKLPGGKRVHFKLVEGDTEKDNNKSANGDDRRFMLAAEKPVTVDQGELVVRFLYRPDADQRKQKELNEAASKAIMTSGAADTFVAGLSASAPSASVPTCAMLDRHLADYTARNTFDYFIHKRLASFLTRELDFYIKNEVMHLDDVEKSSFPKVDQLLSRIRVLRRIAQKIIAFLSHIEDFQKKLWLKKKFVVSSHWLVTVDRVAASLRKTVVENTRQWEQWASLGFKPSSEESLLISSPTWATDAYLNAHPFLVIDTSLFAPNFTVQLLSSTEVLNSKDTLDDASTGVLFRSENFQALSLMQERYRSEVKSVYADPPYNTDATPINYKNGYKDGSWLSLMADRLAACEELQDGDCVSCLTIDDVELHTLRTLIERSMGLSSLLGCVTIKNNPAGRTGTVGMSVMHEYALFYGANETTRVGRLEHSTEQKARYKESDEGGAFEWTNFRKHGGGNTFREKRPRQFYPIYVDGETIRIPKMTWDDAKRAYDVLEQPSASEVTLYPIDNQGRERIWDFVVDTSRKQLSHLRVKKDVRGEVGVYRKWRIHPEGMLPPTVWDKSKYSAAEYGTNLLSRMFGATQTFAFPKSVHAVEDCLRVAGLGMNDTGIALDYFAGSGTTAHAVMNLNREDDGQRRYILVEMGEHFNTVLKPRIAKVIYSPDWKDGKAQSHEKGLSSLVKVLQLESYEDTLNNLRLRSTSKQQSLLAANPTVAEEYTLNYVLDEETKGSPSLLNVEAFNKPFEYTLNIATGTVGESRATSVDLVETFNWLLGLRVKSIDTIKGVRVISGTNPRGEKVLILWRNVKEMQSPVLDEFFQKQRYNTKDTEFDVIYVNGDNNLENLKKDEETWKVRLIEEDFKRLMFDVQDV